MSLCEDMPILPGREVIPFQPVSEPDGKLKQWQAYIGDMQACCHISHAAIYSLQDGAMLASSAPDFGLSKDEFRNLVDGIRLPNLLRDNGIWVSGEMFKHHVSDGKYGVMGKRGLPVCGMSACLTLTLLLVAVHGPKMKPSVCNEAVMTLGDFFRAKGL